MLSTPGSLSKARRSHPLSARKVVGPKPRRLFKRPEWNSTTHDLSVFKLSPEDLRKRKAERISRHNTLYIAKLAEQGECPPDLLESAKKLLQSRAQLASSSLLSELRGAEYDAPHEQSGLDRDGAHTHQHGDLDDDRYAGHTEEVDDFPRSSTGVLLGHGLHDVDLTEELRAFAATEGGRIAARQRASGSPPPQAYAQSAMTASLDRTHPPSEGVPTNSRGANPATGLKDAQRTASPAISLDDLRTPAAVRRRALVHSATTNAGSTTRHPTPASATEVTRGRARSRGAHTPLATPSARSSSATPKNAGGNASGTTNTSAPVPAATHANRERVPVPVPTSTTHTSSVTTAASALRRRPSASRSPSTATLAEVHEALRTSVEAVMAAASTVGLSCEPLRTAWAQCNKADMRAARVRVTSRSSSGAPVREPGCDAALVALAAGMRTLAECLMHSKAAAGGSCATGGATTTHAHAHATAHQIITSSTNDSDSDCATDEPTTTKHTLPEQCDDLSHVRGEGGDEGHALTDGEYEDEHHGVGRELPPSMTVISVTTELARSSGRTTTNNNNNNNNTATVTNASNHTPSTTASTPEAFVAPAARSVPTGWDATQFVSPRVREAVMRRVGMAASTDKQPQPLDVPAHANMRTHPTTEPPASAAAATAAAGAPQSNGVAGESTSSDEGESMPQPRSAPRPHAPSSSTRPPGTTAPTPPVAAASAGVPPRPGTSYRRETYTTYTTGPAAELNSQAGGGVNAGWQGLVRRAPVRRTAGVDSLLQDGREGDDRRTPSERSDTHHALQSVPQQSMLPRSDDAWTQPLLAASATNYDSTRRFVRDVADDEEEDEEHDQHMHQQQQQHQHHQHQHQHPQHQHQQRLQNQHHHGELSFAHINDGGRTQVTARGQMPPASLDHHAADAASASTHEGVRALAHSAVGLVPPGVGSTATPRVASQLAPPGGNMPTPTRKPPRTPTSTSTSRGGVMGGGMRAGLTAGWSAGVTQGMVSADMDVGASSPGTPLRTVHPAVRLAGGNNASHQAATSSHTSAETEVAGSGGEADESWVEVLAREHAAAVARWDTAGASGVGVTVADSGARSASSSNAQGTPRGLAMSSPLVALVCARTMRSEGGSGAGSGRAGGSVRVVDEYTDEFVHHVATGACPHAMQQQQQQQEVVEEQEEQEEQEGAGWDHEDGGAPDDSAGIGHRVKVDREEYDEYHRMPASGDVDVYGPMSGLAGDLLGGGEWEDDDREGAERERELVFLSNARLHE